MELSEKQAEAVYKAVINLSQELDEIFGAKTARKALPDEFLGKLEEHIVRAMQKYWEIDEHDDDRVYSYEVPANF